MDGFVSRPFVKINLSGNSNLTIGNNTYIESFSSILCKGEIIIGSNVSIASNTMIVDCNHKIIKENYMFQRGDDFVGKINIGNFVWVGSGTVILPNVQIGDGVVIGANTLVNKNVPLGVIFGGIPGKIIGAI